MLVIGGVVAKLSAKNMIAAFSAGFSAMIVAVFVFTVWKGHTDVNEHARQRSQELTRTLEEHIIRTFRSADHTLNIIATQFVLGRGQGESLNLSELLNRYVLESQELAHIIVLGPDAQRIASSSPIKLVDQEGPLRDAFTQNMKASTKYNLNVGLVRDADRGRWYIAVSQPMTGDRQRSFGTVVGLISTDFINRFYKSFALEDLDSMSLFHADGTALARIPFPEKLLGRSFAQGKLFTSILPQHPRGVSEAPKKTDGIQRLVSHARVSGLPLVVTVGLKQDRYLATWWRQFNILLPVFLAAIGVVFGLTTALLRYLGRLQKAEATLSQEMEFTSQLLNREGAALVVLDEVGRIQRINEMTSTLTGHAEPDLLGKSFVTELLEDAQDWSLERTRAEVLVRTDAFQRELVWVTKDGERCIMLCSFTVMKDKYGRSPLLAVSAIDVSERVQREEELRIQATSDGLTGILNRRHFFDLGAREFKKSMRLGHDLVVLVLDPDNFKSINDTWGHPAGDAALRNFTRMVQASLREIDIFGRIGGDEFAIVLPETSLEDAVLVAERIRKVIETQSLDHNGARIQYTVSIGVAVLDVVHLDFATLLSCADEALYMAKENGRNQVVRHQPEFPDANDDNGATGPVRH